MDDDQQRDEAAASPSRRYFGPEGLGEQAARALEQGLAAGGGVGAVAEESFFKRWFEQEGCLIKEAVWSSHPLISARTAEHEVRYRELDHRALKRTWPGTFGLVPSLVDGQWKALPATPGGYLRRMALQNELFADDIRLEGAMIGSGPSMLIGQPPGGLSLVISQTWLDAADPERPHPDESEIAVLMGGRGFHPLIGSLYGWRRSEPEWIVLDAKPDNFVSTSEGILPIDLLITSFQVAA
jgi:hypothetical protein